MIHPKVKKIEKQLWLLEEDWTVKGVTIKAGLPFNGASIPSWLQWLVKPDGQLFTASIYHDYMLRNGLENKYKVDWHFYLLARKTGANLPLCVVSLIAVLAFSSGNYK